MRDLLAFCESERPWLLETIEGLVRLESPSTDKAAEIGRASCRERV